MPICEADPWRLQYFERAVCPPGVNIPTEDSDAWLWFPHYRWVYDKVAIALSQGLDAGPHGVPPPRFPVFSKPIVNLNAETIGGRIIEVHLRMSDQWPDLYGAGWIEALVRLYHERRWEFADAERLDGYSVVLFGPHGRRYRHPPPPLLAQMQRMPGV